MVLLATWAIVVSATETPIGRFLHRFMVKLPAAALNRVSRGHLVLLFVLAGFGGLVAWVGGADGLRMVSMAAPDAVASLATIEVSSLLDVIAALAVALALMRLRGVGRSLVTRLKRLVRQPTTGGVRPRCSRRRAAIAPANDVEDGAGLAPAS